MSRRWPFVCASLILAFSVSSFAQSLGDIARETRAKQQRRVGPRARVITNDDIATAEPVKDASRKDSQDTAQITIESAHNSDLKNGVKSPNNPAKEREERELETQKRTNEINQKYIDRIAAIRAEIDGSRSRLTKLQQNQMESTYEFRRTLGVSPNYGTYEQQQHSFNEQIEAERNLITKLSSQLDDAQESARHAGVPHSAD